MEAVQSETLLKAVKCTDEVFHLRLYDWFIDRQLSSMLLDLETPYIQRYLEMHFANRDENCKDLLWKYLAKHRHNMQAARVLDELSQSPDLYNVYQSA